mgnify:CR=1 FL=1
MQRCVKCGNYFTEEDRLLCKRCRVIEEQEETLTMMEVRDFEKRKYGQTFDEFLMGHSKDCPKCEGNMVLALYCFWGK